MEWLDRPMYRVGAYILFGVVAFGVSLMLTFPDDQVKQIAAVQIEHQLERNLQRNYAVEVSDLDPWWLGIELEGLKVERRDNSTETASTSSSDDEKSRKPKKKKKKKKDAESSAFEIAIPSIGVRFAPLGSLLNAGVSVQYHVGMGGGAISGAYTRGTGAQYLSLDLGDIALEESPLLEQLSGIPTFGKLSGYGDFTFALDRPVVTDGSFELRGKKITVGPKKELKLEALPMGHASIPQINFGDLQLDLHVENDGSNRPTVVLDEFRSNGNHLQSQIWGTIQLSNRIGMADTRLKSRIRFNPEFASQHKVIQGLQRNEKFQNGKNGNWYGLVFWGKLSNLEWKGSPTAAQGPEESDGGPPGGQKKRKAAPKKK